MKKKYERPVIEMERFQLTQQISSCGAIKINLTNEACVLESASATDEMKRLAYAGFFMDVFMDGCKLQATGMEDNDGICVMTNVNVAFSS
jgi:hypothetical protein